MTYCITAAIALTFALSGAAAAQTGSMGVSGTGSDQGSLPAGWDGALADAFFTDPGAGTLRPGNEVRDNWATLTPEQQAEVRSYCSTINPVGDGQAAAGASGQDEKAVGGSAEGVNAETPNIAVMARLCDWVRTF